MGDVKGRKSIGNEVWEWGWEAVCQGPGEGNVGRVCDAGSLKGIEYYGLMLNWKSLMWWNLVEIEKLLGLKYQTRGLSY